jgi:drug/metabolite transporter (DMT)-like permease
MNILILISLMVVGSIFNAIAPIVLKKSNKNINNILDLINPYFIGGLFFYGIAYLITLPPLRYGDIGVMYPIMSLTYVWTYILGVFYLREKNSHKKILGVLIIIIGIIIII